MPHFKQARDSMIESQVRPNKVTDGALLAALRSVSREIFLPEPLRGMAYVDEDIILGNGRFLLEPMILARLVQAAQVQTSDAVLDIGCGTGYSTAVLGALAQSVTGLECDQQMAAEGQRLLKNLEIKNAAIIRQDDLRQGYAAKAPYDVILINGAVSAVPSALTAQLAEGGRLAAIVSQSGKARPFTPSRLGTAVLITRQGENLAMQNLFEAATPFLAGFEEPKVFIF